MAHSFLIVVFSVSYKMLDSTPGMMYPQIAQVFGIHHSNHAASELLCWRFGVLLHDVFDQRVDTVLGFDPGLNGILQ